MSIAAAMGLAAISLVLVPAAGAGAATFVRSWGSTGTGNGQFTKPIAIAATPYSVLVADKGRIQEFSTGGQHFRTICCWNNQALREPSGIAVGRDGTIYVTDPVLQRIVVFNRTGVYQRYLGYGGASNSPLGYLSEPRGIAIGPNGNLYVADWGRSRVDEYTPAGAGVRSFRVGDVNGTAPSPWGLAFSPQGNLYVATGSWIVEMTPDGRQVRYWGAGGSSTQRFTNAMGVAVGDHGRIFVVGDGTLLSGAYPGRVQEFDGSGSYIGQWGNTPAAPHRLNRPAGIAVVGSNVYLANTYLNRVEYFAA